MILSGKEIYSELNKSIIIEPFNEKQLNPNSYNLRIGNTLAVYEDNCLDMKRENKIKEIVIPEDGFTLMPGKLYLAKTFEYTESHKYLPCLEGRSSIGRLGIQIHVTAGFGDVGFCGNWTLELTAAQPVTIYPFVEVCQIYYQEVKGEVEPYKGKYNNSTEIIGSKLFRDFDK